MATTFLSDMDLCEYIGAMHMQEVALWACVMHFMVGRWGRLVEQHCLCEDMGMPLWCIGQAFWET